MAPGSGSETGATRTSPPEVADLIDRVTRWAPGRPDVVGLLLVGSCARGSARPDSDVDLVLLTTDEAAYASDRWAAELGGGEPVRVRSWGAVTEHRFVTTSGLEVEVDIGSRDWARVDPLDAGTREVVRAGARILYDPKGLLAALIEACTH